MDKKRCKFGRNRKLFRGHAKATLYQSEVYFDPQFRFTSIVKIASRVKQLVTSRKIDKFVNSYFKEALIYRMTFQFKSEFKLFRDNLAKFMLFSFESGSVHQKMEKAEIIKLLSEIFSGLGYLIRSIRKLDVLEPPNNKKN